MPADVARKKCPCELGSHGPTSRNGNVFRKFLTHRRHDNEGLLFIVPKHNGLVASMTLGVIECLVGAVDKVFQVYPTPFLGHDSKTGADGNMHPAFQDIAVSVPNKKIELLDVTADLFRNLRQLGYAPA